MRLKLNGWQRIGIVASICWVIGGGLWGNNLGLHEGDLALSIYKICLKTYPEDWPGCGKTFDYHYVEATKYHWYYAAFMAFAPIPLAWLAVYGVIGIWRWIKRGFAT